MNDFKDLIPKATWATNSSRVANFRFLSFGVSNSLRFPGIIVDVMEEHEKSEENIIDYDSTICKYTADKSQGIFEK